MKPKEWYFYAAVGFAVSLSELAGAYFGFLYCLAIPMMFIAAGIGLWVLKKDEDS